MKPSAFGNLVYVLYIRDYFLLNDGREEADLPLDAKDQNAKGNGLSDGCFEAGWKGDSVKLPPFR